MPGASGAIVWPDCFSQASNGPKVYTRLGRCARREDTNCAPDSATKYNFTIYR
jgi:hypothetical protein